MQGMLSINLFVDCRHCHGSCAPEGLVFLSGGRATQDPYSRVRFRMLLGMFLQISRLFLFL